MGKIISSLRAGLYRSNEALRTGGLSERRQVGEAPSEANTQTVPHIGLSNAEKQKVLRVLGYIDLSSVADQVVSELDSEYAPMDNSFDAATARRVANLTISKVVEQITGLTEGDR
jgi:hypothetical protein